jgi:hypothetical protein
LHTALELTIPQQEQINSAIQNLWLSVPEREPSSDSGHLIRDLSLKSLEGILTPAQLEQVLLWED